MLKELFNSQTKAIILTRLFHADIPKFHLRELARDGGISAPGLMRELTHFHELKLICKEALAGQTRYYANQNSELFQALCNLVDKSEGLHEKLRRMLAPLQTKCIFIFGSEAAGTATQKSDIDLFLVGNCSMQEISTVLLPAADITNREINPYAITPKEFREKYKNSDHFLTDVLNTPKIFLKGGENELKRLVG